MLADAFFLSPAWSLGVWKEERREGRLRPASCPPPVLEKATPPSRLTYSTSTL